MRTVKPIPFLKEKSHYGYLSTMVLYIALLGLFAYWNLTRTTGINWSIWALQSAPLLLLLPGILKTYYRSFSWLCFLMLFYFIKATEGAFMTSATFTDYLFIVLVALLFVSSMLCSRWMQRVAKLEQVSNAT